jgi:arsenate reductase (thioredoxin)
MGKIKVLFLCTGNSARSQMAEAFLRRYAGDQFDAYSAGLEPRGINPYTIRVMEEIGYDLKDQSSKAVAPFLFRQHFGYVITVCARAEANCPIFPGVPVRLSWPFEDPAALEGSEKEKLAKFREIRDQIDERVQTWLRELGFSANENPNDHPAQVR